MKRYSEYKHTGLQWFPEIPAGWEWRLLSQAVKEQTIKKPAGDMFTVMSLSYGNVIRKKNIDAGLVPSNYDNYQMVYDGNIILRLTDLQNDHTSLRTGLVKETGIITSAYTCLTPRENAQYIHYLLHSYDTRKVFYGMGGGVRQSIGYKDIRSMGIPVPPREEQDQIVRYLDWQVSRINRLIAAKKKQIALLKEQHRGSIEHLISYGTHNEVTQSTGNPWITVAPISWKRFRHKNVLMEKKTIVGDKCGECTLLSLTTNGIIVRDVASGKGKFPSDFTTYQAVEPGDMVFCLFDVDETPRTVGLSNHHGMITGAYTVFQPHDALSRYLMYYFTVIDNKKGFKPIYSGLRKVVGKDVFARQTIYLPSIDEQAEIVERIDNMLVEGRNLIDAFEKQILTLHELRSKLISDIVTGRIDVRSIDIPDFVPVEETIFDEETEGDEDAPEEAEEQEE